MQSGLSVSRNYLNSYEAAYHKSKYLSLYDDDVWFAAARDGSLNQQILALDLTKDMDKGKFYSDYGLQYGNADTKAAALYNEAFADRTKLTQHSINTRNEYGESSIQTVEMTDYDYNKAIIQQQNEVYRREYLQSLEENYYNDMHILVKIGASIVAIPSSLLRGAVAGIDDITEVLGATVAATINSLATGEEWAKEFGTVLASDQFRWLNGVEEALISVEKASVFRNANGSFTKAGAIVIGVTETLGKLVPTALLAYFGGSAVLGSVVFYTSSEFTQSYEQHYEQAVANDLDISYTNALLTDFGITVGKWAISAGLAAALGGTSLGAYRNAIANNPGTFSATASKLLTTLKVFGSDALEEGLEEVLQDSLDALVYSLKDGDYAELSELSLEDMVLTFVVAAISGGVGVGIDVVTTSRIAIEVNNKTVLLDKVSSYLLNSNLTNVLSDLHDAKNMVQKLSTTADYQNSKAYKQYSTKIVRSISALQTITELFGEIGEVRMNNIIRAVDRISKAASRGMFDKDVVARKIDDIITSVVKLPRDYAEAVIEKLAEDLAAAAIEDVSTQLSNDASDIDLELDKDEEAKLNELSKQYKQLHVAKGGKDAVVATSEEKDTVILPKKVIQKYSVNDIIKIVAHKKVTNLLITMPHLAAQLTTLRKLYNRLYNTKASTNTVVNALFTNDAFFIECLHSNNSEILECIHELMNIVNTNLKQFDKHFDSALEKQYGISLLKKYLTFMQSAYTNYVASANVSEYDTSVVSAEQSAFINAHNIRPLLWKAFKIISTSTGAVEWSADNLTKAEQALVKQLVAKYYNQSVDNIISIGQIRSIIDKFETERTVSSDYLSTDTQPNRYCNAWLKSTNMTKDTLLLPRAGEESMSEVEIFENRKAEFETITNGVFTLVYDKFYAHGNFQAIYVSSDIDNRKSVDYDKTTYKLKTKISNKPIDTKTTYIAASTKSECLARLVNDSVTNVENLTLDDIVNNPRMLNEDIRSEIQDLNGLQTGQLGDIVDDRIVTYVLRKHILKMTNGKTSLVQLNNGDYVFADVTSYSDLVDKSKFKQALKTTGAIANNFTKGIAKDLNVKFVIVRGTAPSTFNENTMTITINVNTQNFDILYDTVCHEIVHALQYFNNQTTGYSAHVVEAILRNSSLTATEKQQLITEIFEAFEVYFPGISSNISQRIKNFKIDSSIGIIVDRDVQLIDKILYYGNSGELSAYGLDNDVADLKFVPVLAKKNCVQLSNGRKILTNFDNYITHRSFSVISSNYYTQSTDAKSSEQNALGRQLYNHLTFNLNEQLATDNEYNDMYTADFKKWQTLYSNADTAFENMQSSQQIKALNEAAEEVNVNNSSVLAELRDKVLANLSPDDRITTLKLAHAQIAPTLTFEQFLDSTIPFVCKSSENITSKASSVFIGSYATETFATVLNTQIANNNKYIIGSIKPNDLFAYIEPSTFQALLDSKKLMSAADYIVSVENNNLLVYDKYAQTTELANSNTLQYSEYDPSIYEELNEEDAKQYTNKSSTSKYTSRKVLRNKKSGKIKYEYGYDYSNRQISKKNAGNTNLKYYVGAQLSNDMQQFVVNASDKNAPDYIADIKKGKLTRQALLKDFAFGQIENNDTFELINDSFYKNNNVHSLQELDELIQLVPDAWSVQLLLRAAKMDEQFSDLPPTAIHDIITTFTKDGRLSKIYSKLSNKYDRSYFDNNRVIDIDNNYLRVLIMKYYDGTISSLKQIATIARTVASEGFSGLGDTSKTSVSVDSTVRGKNDSTTTFADKLTDAAAKDLVDLVDSDRDDMINAILEDALNRIAEKSVLPDFNKDKYYKWYMNLKKQLSEATDAQIIKTYWKIFKNELSVKHVETKIDTSEDEGLLEIAKRKLAKDTSNLVRGIRHQIATIKKHLSPSDAVRFLQDNSDIFNDDFTLKENVIHDKDSSGKLIYKDYEVVNNIKQRINKLSIDVRSNVYSSKKAVNYRKKLDKEIAKYKKQLTNAAKQRSKGTAVTFVEQDRSLTFVVDRSVPQKLQSLLEYILTKKADSNIQYLSQDNEQHTVISMKNFVNDNYEILSTLSQDELIDIVDFYLTSTPISVTDVARYTSLQVMILSYIYKSVEDGLYTLDKDRMTAIYNTLKTVISNAGTQLDTWKTAMKMFKPAETILSQYYNKYGVEVTVEQLQRLSEALKTKDPKRFVQVRTEIYEEMLKQNRDKRVNRQRNKERAALQKTVGDGTALKKVKAPVDSFFGKLWRMERAFMLSSPGTWLRNIISNAIIGGVYIKDKRVLPGVNTLAGKVGEAIAKMLPKKWRKENQYKIVGTKVSSEVAAFIKTNYLDNNLINMISDAVSKYDSRRISSKQSTERIYAELITGKLAQDVYNNNHKVAAFFAKMLSDDKAVRRDAIRYFGKILTENDRDLSKGITNDITNDFVDAYLLAANDYMHKTNFLHKFEEVIATRFGDTGTFVWKQFFPFASSALNWFAESLNYTPVGLAKAIVNFAKLEKQIDKIDVAKSRGEATPSSKFAQYLAIRNIGKGVIGSIGMLIGGLLALSGLAQLDEDDEKYKLRIGNVLIDISELFGTQGILLGIGVFQGIKDNKNGEEIIQQTFNTLFEDSLYTSILNMFRYNGTDTYSNVKSYLTYNIPSMFVPSVLKTITTLSKKYNVQYSTGLLGKIEKLGVNSIPFLDRTMAKKIDIYTGEEQIAYNSWFLDVLLSKAGTVKFKTLEMSNLEETALLLDIHKTQLSGNYVVNGADVKLSAGDISKTNAFYAKLNKSELTKFINNRDVYSVLVDNKYKTLRYSQMTTEQKATVFERIMSNNSSLSKIYILTSNNSYKYYASDSEYSELRKLGITRNVYRQTGKLTGFVKK